MSQERSIQIKFKAQGHAKLKQAIQALAKAQDNLAKIQKKVANTARQAANENKKFNDNVKKSKKGLFDLNRSMRLTDTNFASLRSKLLLASFGFTLFSQSVLRFVNSASRQEEILNKFNVVFGRNANEVREWADAYAESIGRAETDLLEMAASFQDIFVPMGFVRSEAKELSKGLSQLAIDVASFNNATDAEVMAAFQSAIVGNHETVRKYGIVITEATLQAEAMESGIIDTNRALTQEEKVLARVNLLIKGSADAHGDAGRTSDSYANTVKALQAAWKEFSETMGRQLMPILSQVMKFFISISPLTNLLATRIVELTAVYALFRVKLINTTVTMGLYNTLTKTGIKLTRKLRLAVAKSGVGLLIIGLAELADRMGWLGDEAEFTADAMDNLEDSMTPDYKQLEQFTVFLAQNTLSIEQLEDKIKALEQVNVGMRLNAIMQDFQKAKELGKEDLHAMPYDQYKAFIDSGGDYLDLAADILKKDIEIRTSNRKQSGLYTRFKQELPIDAMKELGLTYIETEQGLGMLTLTMENYKIISDLLVSGDENHAVLKEKLANMIVKSNAAMMDLLPTIESENALLQAKLDHSGADLAYEELKIKHAHSFNLLSEEKKNKIKEELKETERLNKEIADKLELEKETEKALKAVAQEQQNQISSIVDASVAFGVYTQDVAKNFRELSKVILRELQRIIQKFITNQILFSIFGIGTAPTLFGSTLSQLFQGLGGGGAGGATTSAIMGGGGFSFPVAHTGGMIRSYHQGGNVPIIAQEGEFVMRRDAVDSIGAENLARMNATGQSGGVNITFSGNVLSKQFIEREAIPAIRDAVRRGARLTK